MSVHKITKSFDLTNILITLTNYLMRKYISFTYKVAYYETYDIQGSDLKYNSLKQL